MSEVYFSSLTFTSWFIPTPFSVFHTLSQVLSNTIVVRHAMILCRTSIQSGIIYNYNTSILNLIWTSAIHSWKIVFVVISLLKVLTKKKLTFAFWCFSGPLSCGQTFSRIIPDNWISFGAFICSTSTHKTCPGIDYQVVLDIRLTTSYFTTNRRFLTPGSIFGAKSIGKLVP